MKKKKLISEIKKPDRNLKISRNKKDLTPYKIRSFGKHHTRKIQQHNFSIQITLI